MKKFLLVALALLLALPAISFAGSTGSKWDVTFGGYVKFDYGYADQGVNADLWVALPKKAYRSTISPLALYAGDFSLASKYGALYGAGYETRINMLIKGPDAWGAKTSAFIEGDFRGGNGTPTGTFMLRHAFMKWNWAKTELLLGHTWQAWGGGTFNGWNVIGFMENHIFKGNRQPQIRLTQWFGKNKNWKATFAVASPSTFLGQTSDGSGANMAFTGSGMNDATRTNWPHFQGDIEWSTRGCGLSGQAPGFTSAKMPFIIGLGGFYGKDRKTYSFPQVSPTSPTVYSSEYVKSWGIGLRTNIPIIPAKANTRAMSLNFAGAAFVGQNMGFYIPQASLVIYNQNLTRALIYDYTTATSYGGFAGLTFFFTDKIFTNVIYGTVINNNSYRMSNFESTPPNALFVKQHQNWIVNVMYNVNDAIRLGLEYAWIRTDYNSRGTWSSSTLLPPSSFRDKSGTMNTIRLGAFYFF